MGLFNTFNLRGKAPGIAWSRYSEHPHVWIGYAVTDNGSVIQSQSGSWVVSAPPEGDPTLSLISDGRFRLTFASGAVFTEGRYFLSFQDAEEFGSSAPVDFQYMDNGPTAIDIWASDALTAALKTPGKVRYKLELYPVL